MFDILERFCLDGKAVSCKPYGSGHINRTHLVTTERGHAYILQKINDDVFQDVSALMHNISSVTRHLRAAGLDERHVLTLVPADDGAEYIFFDNGETEKAGYYRVYEFISDGLSLDHPENEWVFRQSALAFGRFQMQLKDFPAATLAQTIPKFHDTIDRYRLLRRAIDADALGRAAGVAREIDFALERERYAGCMLRMLECGELPLRVTHNDTKLNNVVFDAATREPLCVVDLDTVMPGLSGNDFGDSIRFGANHSAEDEKDLSKVNFDIDLFEIYTKGFLETAGGALTEKEKETLPWGAKLMTLECGIRFLTDYLEGDHYFKVHREGQNLDRCRTQFKLVSDMESQWDAMAAVVKKYM